MKWIRGLRRGGAPADTDRGEAWSLDDLDRPWGDAEPILARIRAAVVDGALPRDPMPLPASPDDDDDELKWAAGARDGVLGHHASPGEAYPALVIEALRRLQEHPTPNALADLAATAHDLLALADPLSQALGVSGLRRERVAAIGRVLAWEAPYADQVKLGLVLVGMAGVADVDAGPVRELALHDELTLFAWITLARLGADERDLWTLARRVHGWGRIHLVERLRGTTDPAIRDWLLRDGFRNDVLDEYLALIAAEAGGLEQALAGETVDDELFDGASAILSALAAGSGAGGDLSDYAMAPAAVGHWLRHARSRAHAETLSVSTVTALADLRNRDDLPPSLTADVSQLAASPEVGAAVLRALDAPAIATFVAWAGLARRFGIDAFEPIAARLAAGEDKHGYLFWLLTQTAGPERFGRVLEVADDVIDLERVASGPGKELGLGDAFEEHRRLDHVLGLLGDHPGRGQHFLLAALRSPVIRNRNLALGVLGRWGPDGRREAMIGALERVATSDPDERVRERAQALLGGPS